MKKINNLKTKIFADGASIDEFIKLNNNSYIEGFTTNPSLMRKNGITNYKVFALDLLKIIREKPISFEVFADDLESMEKQALQISEWGPNVYVKIPVTNTKGESVVPLIKNLQKKKIKLNITAIFTKDQISEIVSNLDNDIPSIISIFCGRIADAGSNPDDFIKFAQTQIKEGSQIKTLWASTREIFNIFQADMIGCDIITVPNELLNKLNIVGKDLGDYSLETVKSFYNDAKNSKYSL